jgi:propanol-preferring alcohol dehydrogenase
MVDQMMMKAVRLHAAKSDLSVDSAPVPQPGPDDVLLKVEAAGICHSDVNYRDGVAPVARMPITLGHEFAGTVAAKGAGATAGVEVGDRVCVHYVVSCGTCGYCASGMETYCERYRMIGKDVDGGFAEFACVPARNVLKVPPSLPFEQAAILGCAVSTAFHALRRGRVREGETVLVNGAGGLGLQAIQLASRVFGAGRVVAVDVSDAKLELAARFGADSTVNAGDPGAGDRIRELTNGRLADVALDFVGRRSTVESLLGWTGKGGRLVVVGISSESVTLSPYTALIGKETEMVGVDDHLRSELVELVRLVGSGTLDLSRSITHRLKLEEVNLGMRMLREQTGNPIRIVVTN